MSADSHQTQTLPPVKVDPADEIVLDMLCAARPTVQRDSFAMWLNNPGERAPYLHIDPIELRRMAAWALEAAGGCAFMAAKEDARLFGSGFLMVTSNGAHHIPPEALSIDRSKIA